MLNAETKFVYSFVVFLKQFGFELFDIKQMFPSSSNLTNIGIVQIIKQFVGLFCGNKIVNEQLHLRSKAEAKTALEP